MLFREIVPAPPPRSNSNPQSSGDDGGDSQGNRPQGSAPPRRSNVRKACNPCKIKKIKCDGKKPCRECSGRKLPPLECRYDPTRDEILELENARLREQVKELESRLSMDPRHAFSATIDLDAALLAADSTAVVAGGKLAYTVEIEAGGYDGHFDYTEAPRETLAYLLTQPSDEAQPPISESVDSAMDGVVPKAGYELTMGTEKWLQAPKKTSLEYELMMRHPIAYPSLAPPDAHKIGVVVRFEPRLPECFSEAKEWAGGVLREIPPPSFGWYCDDRLYQLEVGAWTSVSIDNDLAARILSTYLEVDHATLKLFDADLFLDDLISGCQLYCSPPLVNALLGWSCQAHSDMIPDGSLRVLSVAFFAEAEKLFWQAEVVDSITLVATAVLLELGASMSGNSKLASRYELAGVRIAIAMGLFGVVAPLSPSPGWHGSRGNWIRASSHTAWGVFVFRTHAELHWRSCPFEQPPLLPLPGRDAYMQDDGVICPLPNPKYLDDSFVHDCELAVISHEITWHYYGAGNTIAPSARALSLENAENFYRMLLSWADGLPLNVARGDRGSDGTVSMHMWFHATVLTVFQPFLLQHLRRLRFQTFSSEGSALCAFNASIHQLKRLALTYHKNYEQHHHTVLSACALMFLASSICQLGPSQERGDMLHREPYFAVCIAGLLVFERHQVIGHLIKGLVALALSSHTITSAFAESVLVELARGVEQLGLGFPSPTASMILDYELHLTDKLSSTADGVAAMLPEARSRSGFAARPR